MTNAFNNLNQIMSGSWTGSTITAVGAVNYPAGTVTVGGASGIIYADKTFDAAGVPVALGANTLTNVFTDAFGRSTNRTSSVVVTEKAYAYDLNGNLTNDTRFAYEWDCENRLVAVRDAATGALVQSNRYDALWRRQEKVDYAPDGTATTNRYIYKGWLVLAITDGEGNVLETYTHGADLSGEVGGSAGGIGGILASTQAGGATVYAYDFNGNIVGATSSNQSVLATLTYTPFGEVLARTGPFIPRYQFSTKERDIRTGLNYYGYRFYAPRLGRWMNRDPIGEDGGFNLMSFAMNNPATRFDTDGCFVFPIIVSPDPTLLPPPNPSPSITDHLGSSTKPLGEERWFENNYAGWLAEARRRFTAEINAGVDCSSTTFNGPSGRINIYPSYNRGGSISKQTPGGNEQEFGDAGQSDWSADKVLGSFSIDYVTPVAITYTKGTKGKRSYTWRTIMYIEDVLGTQEGDPIRKIPGVASITPSRRVRRASWRLSGKGECCVQK